MRDESLAQAELAEHVHNGLHGRLVGHGDGRHVQDAVQHETGRGRRRRVARAREYHHCLPSYALHRTASVR